MATVRDASERDIKGIVEVHLASFPGYFPTTLGRRFLEVLYRQIMIQQGSVCLVAEAENRGIIGFAAGVKDQHELYQRLARKAWFKFALAALPAAVRRPEIIPRLIRALRYPTIVRKAACPALLMSVAVSPQIQGSGLGKNLVRRFLDRMAELGEKKVSLTTDRDANDSTNLFYRKLGFYLAREYRTPRGRWMNEYVIATSEPHLRRMKESLELKVPGIVTRPSNGDSALL